MVRSTLTANWKDIDKLMTQKERARHKFLLNEFKKYPKYILYRLIYQTNMKAINTWYRDNRQDLMHVWNELAAQERAHNPRRGVLYDDDDDESEPPAPAPTAAPVDVVIEAEAPQQPVVEVQKKRTAKRKGISKRFERRLRQRINQHRN